MTVRGPVTVVIPVRDGSATIARQLAAVVAQLRDGDELVVVDNGSTDATAEIVRPWVGPQVRVVSEPRRGLNRARNAGVRAARCEAVLLCDADDEVQPGWLAAMAAGLASADLVGGAIEAVDETGAPTVVAVPSADRPVLWDLAAPWGCSCGFRREAWVAVGGFDESLAMGGEETDFFLRAQLAGAALAWVDDAVVRYTVRSEPAVTAARRRARRRAVCHAYWQGRLCGRPRRPGPGRDLLLLVRLVPGAVRGPARARLVDTVQRRVDRALGLRHLPRAIRSRVG